MRTRAHDRAIIPQLLWLSTPYFVCFDFRAYFIRQISIPVNSFLSATLASALPHLPRSPNHPRNPLPVMYLRLAEVLFVWVI